MADLFSRVIGTSASSELNEILSQGRDQFQLTLSSEGLKVLQESQEKMAELLNIADADLVAKVKQEIDDTFRRPVFSLVESLQDLRTVPVCDAEMIMANPKLEHLLKGGVIDGYGLNYSADRLAGIRAQVTSGLAVNGTRRIYRSNKRIIKSALECSRIRHAWDIAEDEVAKGNDGTSLFWGYI